MTTTPADGGPAFPQMRKDPWDKPYLTGGMSLRDWFAGQAINGLLACTVRYDGTDGKMSGYAAVAYDVADAMLAARKEDS